ncbi:MAG TPA: response regulator [Bacteroidales bacterium]|nr:response regulator [Bacteroidales bacterium]
MTDKKKVLFIDDEPINLQLFAINFSRKYHVLTALSGSQAIEVLTHEPEVVAAVCDMKMPVMDGIEFVTIAKNRFPLVKYIILTGSGLTPEISRAIEDGRIYKYFCKPFGTTEIETCLENL